MPPLLQTVHLGCDNLFSRAGAVVTYPAGWTSPARMHDASDFLLARSGGSPPNPSYLTVDLGAGQASLPSYIYVGQTNMGSLVVRLQIDSSDDGVAWTNLYDVAAETDQTSMMHGAIVPTVGTHRYWRVGFIKVGGFSGLQVGEVKLGKSVAFSVHPDVDGYDPTDEDLHVAASRTEAGHLAHARFLGSRRKAHVRVSYADYYWMADATVPTGFRYFVEQFVLTGKPFVWGWSTLLPGPYLRDHFWAKCLNGVSQTFADSYLAGQRMVEFDVVGAREWGRY